MKRYLIAAAIAVFAAYSCTSAPDKAASIVPSIGTAYNGHTFPGATVPFGMVSPSPDTGLNDWQHCAGYHGDDTSILGFSQTHMSGTGAPDMCDLLLIPVAGAPCFEPGPADNPDAGYRSRFSHDSEVFRPGYYAVTLDDYGVRCEMTASDRCSFYRFTYPEGGQAGLLLDMLHGNDGGVITCDVRPDGDRAIKGWRRSRGFIRDHVYYFWAELSEPISAFQGWSDGVSLSEGELAGQISKLYVCLSPGKPLLVRMGVSTVSCEAARANLLAEVAGKPFDKVAEAAHSAWNKAVGCIDASFPTAEQEQIFYTALYHSMVVPNLITDVDGGYRGWDGQVHSSDKPLYTNYSLWDTYRAVHPLYNIVCPERNVAFINSMLARYDQTGMLPINEYGTCETFCMIGYHAVPVIADAIIQDLPGFDREKAWKAMKSIAEEPDRGASYFNQFNYVPADLAPNLEFYKEHGYVPADLEPNSVSKTLEYAFDDWCISKAAEKLGYKEDAEYFAKRAKGYANVYDPETGFTRGRLSDGSWRTPFDPDRTAAHDHDFIEGNAWQYTFYVPHDIDNYVTMNGGPEAFAAKLDTMFTRELSQSDIVIPDVTGLIGQYAHGNEPSHHVAYLYNHVGEPRKTQELVARIKDEMYDATTKGLCGNDDCGQMSAWYVFSALGFYPVAPGSGIFEIGSPSVREASIRLSGGKTFTISTQKEDGSPIDATDIYIREIRLNGQPLEGTQLPLDAIRAGGKLVFVME